MSAFTEIATEILASIGEEVSYQPAGTDPASDSAVLLALVTHHGMGHCPEGWNSDQFPNQGRHAAFRLSAADVSAEPKVEDKITHAGLVYTVRQVLRVPKAGPEVLWWECLAACQQRGKF
jgi:hypothetical protein